MSEKIKIFMVDDHQIVIDAVKKEIESQSDQFEFVGSANDGKEALMALETVKSDILILDINMPNVNGMQVLKEVTQKYPKLKVLVLTMLDDLKHIREMIENGAKGYVLKNKSSQFVVEALTTISEGEDFFPDDVAQIAIRDFVRDDDHKKRTNKETILKSISAQDSELLGWITLGLSDQELADKMHLSKSAIESRKRNLRQKTGVNNALELMRFAMDNGFKKDKEG